MTDDDDDDNAKALPSVDVQRRCARIVMYVYAHTGENVKM